MKPDYPAIIVLLSVIDVAYTGVGAFYGGGGAELNPLLSWLTDPLQFITAVFVLKVIGIAVILAVLWWTRKIEQSNDIITHRHLGAGTVVVYSLALFGILALNVWYQIAGG